MVRPSRFMPPFIPPRVKWRWRALGYVVLAGLVGIYAWAVWSWPLVTLGGTLALAGVSVLMERRYRARIRTLAASRGEEALCTFARALPVRELDTWVVRAVFEQLQNHLRDAHPAFPLRPSDRPVDDLQVDPDDLDDLLAQEIAQRAGRTLAGSTANPYYGKVATVEDLIRFFCAQPRSAT